MKITVCVVGLISTNCYIIEDGGEALIVDPGGNGPQILKALEGLKPVGIVLTHSHWDHIGALPDLEEALDAPTMAHELDADEIYKPTVKITPGVKDVTSLKPIERRLKQGDEVKVGNCTFTVIHSPGHTPGSMCLFCPEEKVLISGDTLFAGGRFGRTDFETGSMEDMVESLTTKFVNVPDDVEVFPGHEQSSIMSRERMQNPYLR